MDIALSINNVPIRLTTERWDHISHNHDDLVGYYYDVLNVVKTPDMVLNAYGRSLMAIKNYGKKKYLCVIYKEISRKDGFIITAYFSTNVHKQEYKIVWQKK